MNILLYKCFRCENKFFSAEETVEHLKNFHHVRQKDDPMLCIAANSNCGREYYTFQKLKLHAKECVKKVYLVRV